MLPPGVLAVAPACADVPGGRMEPCAVAEELPSVEPPVLLPMAGGAPMALVPEDGAPMAVLPGVVGPDMLPPVPGAALPPALELLPYAPGPLLPMAPLLPGVVVLPATDGLQGMVLGDVLGAVVLDGLPGDVPEYCAKANPLAASVAASMLAVNALIDTPSTVVA